MSRAYIFIETAIGRAGQVIGEVRLKPYVVSADRVTGPYDIIAYAEPPDLDALGKLVRDVSNLDGVRKNIAALAL